MGTDDFIRRFHCEVYLDLDLIRAIIAETIEVDDHHQTRSAAMWTAKRWPSWSHGFCTAHKVQRFRSDLKLLDTSR